MTANPTAGFHGAAGRKVRTELYQGPDQPCYHLPNNSDVYPLPQNLLAAGPSQFAVYLVFPPPAGNNGYGPCLADPECHLLHLHMVAG